MVGGEESGADGLRGFGPAGIAAILVVLAAGLLAGPLAATVFVLAWARLSRTPMEDLGLRRPARPAPTLVAAAAFGVSFKILMKAVVLPLVGAPAENARYHYLAGNAAALPRMLAAVIVGAGFAEEVFFRGYLFERLGRVLGRGRAALLATVAITAALFAIAHYPEQGLPGVEQAAATGLVFGALYARRRELWTPIVAHAAFDVAAVALIYWRLEEPLAHALFR